MTTETIRTALTEATNAARIRITFAARSSTSPDEVREVTVTGKDGRHIYTTSGKVRPGHTSGGAILDYGDVFYFQPTLAQAIREVRSVEVLAVALPLS